MSIKNMHSEELGKWLDETAEWQDRHGFGETATMLHEAAERLRGGIESEVSQDNERGQLYIGLEAHHFQPGDRVLVRRVEG